MLGAERLFADRQRALEERPRPRKVALGLEQDGEVVEARRRIGMLGAEHLFADRQRALVERPRPCKVALGLKQDGEVVEALAVSGCSGPSTFSRIASASRRRGCRLGVSRAPEEIAACPVQEAGPVCNVRSVIGARFAPRKQMRSELGAQRPRLRIAVAVLGIDRHQPCNQSPYGILRRAFCLRPRSCHCLHETMHRHRRRAVLEGVVLQERDFGERGERLQALRFVLNRALDQRHWDALGRALGEIRHERFRRWALRHGLGDGEVEGRGDAPGIARAARCCI